MSAAAVTADGGEAVAAPKGGKKKLLLLAVPVLLAAVGAGLWFGGILPPLLGMGGAKPAAHGESKPGESKPGETKPGETKPAEGKHGEAKPAETKHGEAKPSEAKAGETAKPGAGEAAAGGPPFVDVPDIVANLNNGNRRTTYVKLHARLELARAEDDAAAKAAMPRLLDLFQTYLREMRPEELRGSAGTYRLREELIARANVALAPARVADLLFIELLIQ